MQPITITFAVHVAYLDPDTGQGFLVMARPEDDLMLDGGSLHSADWTYAIAELDRLGWEPTEDDDGGFCYDGDTTDGRAVFGLYGRESITSIPSLAESLKASQELAWKIHTDS